MFSVMLRSCTARMLAHVLDPAVPFVWIPRHIPNRYLRWWSTQTCLFEAGPLNSLEVRSMEFDIQLSTSRFLELLPEFEHHGLVLFQMTRRVPDTLTLQRVPDGAVDGILRQNGLHLRVHLPEEEPWGQLTSPHREVLERALQKPQVREVAYGPG
jgi:hypothetical protein